MAIRISPGTEKPHECQGHKKSVSRNGTWFAETIKASDKYIASTGRTQDSTRPRHAETSKKCLQRRSHPHKTLIIFLAPRKFARHLRVLCRDNVSCFRSWRDRAIAEPPEGCRYFDTIERLLCGEESGCHNRKPSDRSVRPTY